MVDRLLLVVNVYLVIVDITKRSIRFQSWLIMMYGKYLDS